MSAFNYSKNILKGMNTVEDLVKNGMFHEILPEFTANFWLANDQRNEKELRVLSGIMDKIIDDLKAGNSFVLDRVKKSGK